jgi:AbrB family looped-hinge helix DNA binding protein
MNTARLSSKGQVVIPTALRAARAWKAGTRFEVVDTAEGVLLKPLGAASPFGPTRIEDVSAWRAMKARSAPWC